MQDREPTTTVDFIPTPGNVLLSVEYELPFMAFTQDKIEIPNSKFIVRGYGKGTSVELNSIAQMNSDYRNPFPFLVKVPTNSKSYFNYSRVAKTLDQAQIKKLMQEGNKYKVIDLICVPEYAITGTVNENTISHKFISENSTNYTVISDSSLFFDDKVN